MNRKINIYLALCCFSLFISCDNQKKDVPGEKYKTLTVTTGNQVLKSTYPATLRGRQAVEVRPASKRNHYENMYQRRRYCT